jgi:DNA repair exonuclease SbcCD ATPase subunit
MFGLFKLAKRVKELEESFERIEHAYKKLEIDWADTYDKFRQLHWRVAKRAKQLEQTPDAVESEITEASPQTSLSARQKELNDKILARRNRTGGNGGLLHG